MLYRLKNTALTVYIHKKGAQVIVYKNGEKYFHGQYFPMLKKLWCPEFKFESVREFVEKSINNRIKPGDVIFPYYSNS